MNEPAISPAFTHEKNIRVGQARVIYDLGWRLPGCRVTNDYVTALEFAGRMNWLMCGDKVKKEGDANVLV